MASTAHLPADAPPRARAHAHREALSEPVGDDRGPPVADADPPDGAGDEGHDGGDRGREQRYEAREAERVRPAQDQQRRVVGDGRRAGRRKPSGSQRVNTFTG